MTEVEGMLDGPDTFLWCYVFLVAVIHREDLDYTVKEMTAARG